MEPQLKFENAFLVDCFSLDKFVAIHLEGFGMSWRSLDTGCDGYHNGSMVSASVTFGVEIEDDDYQDFDRWLLGAGPFCLDPEDASYSYESPGIHHMLQWLCNMGRIPQGTYVVHLWW
jgi:hypothetical protein